MFTIFYWSVYHYCPHFRDKRLGVQRGLVALSRSHSKQMALWDLNLSNLSLMLVLLVLYYFTTVNVVPVSTLLKKTYPGSRADAAWWISQDGQETNLISLSRCPQQSGQWNSTLGWCSSSVPKTGLGILNSWVQYSFSTISNSVISI